jgi:hypothetical protein
MVDLIVGTHVNGAEELWAIWEKLRACESHLEEGWV